MTEKYTIILVADVRGWAFDNVAQYVQSLLSDRYDCRVIYSGDFKTYKDFLVKLNRFSSIKLIHFFYRGYLTELLKFIVENDSKNKIIGENLLNIAITTSIPDHLFIEHDQDIFKNLLTFKLIDNYYTTSKKLYDIYTKISDYPKPSKIIHDNIIIQNPCKNWTIHSDALAVTWIGNSSWGSWQSSTNDYKGLKTIITPALKQLNDEGIAIESYIVDKNDTILPREKIWQILEKTDILLIASSQEGTPLTLIEAMAFGCVIITTDVGIAQEVLPEIQHDFIINRHHLEFVDSIKKLNANRKLLATIQQENFSYYQKIFADKDKFQISWYSFIEDSINNYMKKQQLQTKKQIIQTFTKHGDCLSLTNKLFQKITTISLLKKITFYLMSVNWFKPIIMLLIKILYYLIPQNEYSNFKNLIIKYQSTQKNSDDAYVIYSNIFPGVSNSTEGLFDKFIPFPINKLNLFIAISDKVMTKIAKLIIEMKIKRLIISGGLDVHIQLVNKLYEIKGNHDLDISFLWHGSPSQWVKYNQAYHFYKWFTLYQQGKIQAIITLKKGLEQFFKCHNIQSYLLQNFIPLSLEKQNISFMTNKFKIGVWSSSSLWIKNLYPQFAAISMLKDQVSCYTNFHLNEKKYTSWIIKNIELKTFATDLPHKELIKLMANTDLTLYITNSECSPMIVLESLSMLVPCLVGPTSGIYDDDEFLLDMLTVNRVDCPVTIFNSIERVRQNIELIKSKLPNFIIKYNTKAMLLKKFLLDNIKK